jgi:hypothetical protein
VSHIVVLVEDDDDDDDDFKVELVHLFLAERIFVRVPISWCAGWDGAKSLEDIASGYFLGLSRGNSGAALKKRDERREGSDDVSGDVYSLCCVAVNMRARGIERKNELCKGKQGGYQS